MKKELGIQDYVNLIIRRRWIIILSAIGVLLAAAIYNFTRPSVYNAASTFMLESQDIGFTPGGMMLTEKTRPLGYYDAVMKSRRFRDRIISEFRIEYGAGVTGKKLSKILQQGISLSTSQYSDFIRLNVRAEDPQTAFNLATMATNHLKERCQEIDREELQNAVDFIENQKEMAEGKLEDAERALQEFRENTNIITTDQEGGLLNEMVKLEEQLTKIQTDKQLAIANLEAYKQRLSQAQDLGGSTLTETESPEVIRIRDEITRLEKQKDDLIQAYGEGDSGVTSLDNEIN